MTRRITLSFDNGPDPAVTPRVLEILRSRSIKALFFMIGEKVATPPGRALADLVRQAGHRLGNHTMTHGAPLGTRPDRDAVPEIARADAALSEFVTGEPLLFRPNAGGGRLGRHVLSPAAAEYLATTGHEVVTWNVVPRDWEDPVESWPERAFEEIERLDHAVVVLHDILPTTADHLPRFLDAELTRSVEFSLEIPADCLAISHGRLLPAAHGLLPRTRSGTERLTSRDHGASTQGVDHGD